jgi:glycerol-3-phosphate dehydrogenase
MTDTDVLVVGGGATGLGIAWDLSLRGLGVTLVEMGDFSSATSGRYHGLLHSGARYVISDPATARECIQENAILRRIAPGSVDDTGGLFVLAPQDDPSFVDPWLAGCRDAGIPAREIPPATAREREPMLLDGIRRAFLVPDAVCHSLVLARALERTARSRGAALLPFHRLEAFLLEGDRVAGAVVTDLRTGGALTIRSLMVVNATGPWAGEIAGRTGIALQMDLARGAMVAYRGRLVRSAIQRLRPPGDADAILPRGRVTIAGTTEVPTSDPGDRRIEPWETQAVTAGLAEILPSLKDAPVAHAWSAAGRRESMRGGGAGASRSSTMRKATPSRAS